MIQLISFYSTKTNMFFVLAFFKLGRPGCRVRPPSYVRICQDFCNPLPPSPRTSFVNGPLPIAFPRTFCFEKWLYKLLENHRRQMASTIQ